ncbi:MAG: calcium-binding protein [Salinibacter sp.]
MPDSTSLPFEVGDAVRVKEDVEYNDDLDWDISGWQGRVVKITDADPKMLLIEWDSVTLENMSSSLIETSEREGLDWEQYYVFPSDVETAEPRDAPQDVKKIRRELHEQHLWTSLGEEGRYVQQILDRATSDDTRSIFQAWEKDLSNRLTFPFEAKVDEYQEGGPLRSGDEVRVTSMVFVDCLYGFIATVRHGRTTRDIPLADLEPLDETSDNYLPLRAYRVWFANHQRQHH